MAPARSGPVPLGPAWSFCCGPGRAVGLVAQLEGALGEEGRVGLGRGSPAAPLRVFPRVPAWFCGRGAARLRKRKGKRDPRLKRCHREPFP